MIFAGLPDLQGRVRLPNVPVVVQKQILVKKCILSKETSPCGLECLYRYIDPELKTVEEALGVKP